MQVSTVHDPFLTNLASVENLSPRGARVTSGRSWELGSHVHVDVKSRAVELTARARVVYCQAAGKNIGCWAELPNSKKTARMHGASLPPQKQQR